MKKAKVKLSFDEQSGRFSLILRDKPRRNTCKVAHCGRRPKGRPVCDRCRKLVSRANAPDKDAFNNLRSSARRRGIPFHLTFGEFVAFAMEHDYLTRKGRASLAAQIDRIENDVGYESGNIQILTASENVAKENRRRAAVRQILLGRGVPSQFLPSEPF